MRGGQHHVGAQVGTTAWLRRSGARRRSMGAVVAAAVMGLTACAGLDDAGGAGTPGGAPSPVDAGVDLDAPLFQVQRSGGFLPFGWDFMTVPELTIYADGRAVTHGPQIAIYPPPALPNLQEHDLADADLDALVAAAREAGLLDTGREYGHPPVADAPTTYVTLTVDGRSYRHAAEALGLAESETWSTGAEPPDVEVVDPDDQIVSGLSEETRRARAQLVALIARAFEVVDAAGDGRPYAIERFAVMAQPVVVHPAAVPDGAPPVGDDAEGSSPSSDDEIPAPVLAWPLDLALAEASDCVVVDGADAQTLLTTLGGTVVTAQFEQAGVRYEAWFRPMLPHEEACTDL